MKQIHPETGICFFRVPAASTLVPFLLGVDPSPLDLAVDQTQVTRWLDMGCVYVDGKRVREDAELAAQQVIRLHTRPKRFPVEKLRTRIVLDHPEFLVLDKPPGLPTHPTLDNYLENAKVLLEHELQTPIYVTHRLDVPTQGLLIMAKNSRAQALLNKNFSLRRVTKIYHALAGRPCAIGPVTHFMDPNSRVPKILSREPQDGWWKCEMIIEEVKSHASGFSHRIRLLTGKTHQIRAQLAALGAPILGDEVYAQKLGKVPERLALECFELAFAFRSETFHVTRPRSIVSP